MIPRVKQALMVAAVPLVLAPLACSKSGEVTGATATSAGAVGTVPATTGRSGGSGATGEAGATVTVPGLKFQQATVTITAGQTVVFDNKDSAVHIPTSGTPDDQTGIFAVTVEGGRSASTPPLQAGTYRYYCDVHPSMKGEIVVE